MYAERLLPNEPEAEEAVIGSILIDGESLTKVSSIIKAGDFYHAKNRWSYEAALVLMERGEGVNQVTVAHELSLRERLEESGGPAYLAHLVRSVPTSVHIEHYARIVHTASVMRQLIETAGDIAAIGYGGTSDVDSALGKAEDLLFKVRTGRGTRDFIHIREVLDTYMEETATLKTGQDSHLGPVPTGFADLDKLFGGGLHQSDMIVVAARPQPGQEHPGLQRGAKRRRARNQRGNLQPRDERGADRDPAGVQRSQRGQPPASRRAGKQPGGNQGPQRYRDALGAADLHRRHADSGHSGNGGARHGGFRPSGAWS